MLTFESIKGKASFHSSEQAWNFMHRLDELGIKAGYPSLDGSNTVQFSAENVSTYKIEDAFKYAKYKELSE